MTKEEALTALKAFMKNEQTDLFKALSRPTTTKQELVAFRAMISCLGTITGVMDRLLEFEEDNGGSEESPVTPEETSEGLLLS